MEYLIWCPGCYNWESNFTINDVGIHCECGELLIKVIHNEKS